MKRVIINAYETGLVFRNGVYRYMIREGAYWFWCNEQIWVYDITKQFIPNIELSILLQDEALKEALHIVEVGDHEIVLQYERGMLKQVLTAGRYAFWKSAIVYDFVWADLSNIHVAEHIDSTILQHKMVAPFVRSYEVQSHEKALLFVDSKYEKVLEPGVYHWWRNAATIHIAKVDTRMQQAEINGQEILTRDKAMLRINARAQYHVTDIEQAILKNKEYDQQLYVAFQMALREYVGSLSFDALLEQKEAIASFVTEKVQAIAPTLGVEVIGFGIRDIILPGDVKEIMNQVLIAEKKAQANIIMRREETASTRSLLNTARLMEENTMLWKLKEMEYVERIAEKISNISVNGNGALMEQLKDIFVSSNKT